jgi:hypothetical protein
MISVSEPDPKRKTLAERAGETRSIAAPTPNSRALVRTTSLVSAGVSFLCLVHYTETHCFPWQTTAGCRSAIRVMARRSVLVAF